MTPSRSVTGAMVFTTAIEDGTPSRLERTPLTGCPWHDVKAKLREANARPTRLRRGRLLLDVSSGQAWLDERRLDLDRKPFLVLYHLALAEGTTLSRDELLRRVWDSGYEKFERSVDQAVYSLRQAIGEPGWVETVHGFGYRFVSHR